jgi:hypothetical protein
MKIYQPLLLIVAIITFSCGKDKFTTVPQVDIKSISPGTVRNGDILNLKGKYRDQEGDVDSVLVVYKWYNGASSVVPLDTFRYNLGALQLPDNTREADIIISFQYNTTNPNGYLTLPGVSVRDTTASLGLIIVDKKGNRSNYAESEKIRLIKP